MSWIEEALARRQQQQQPPAPPQPYYQPQPQYPPAGVPQTVAPQAWAPSYPGQQPLAQTVGPPQVPAVQQLPNGSIVIPEGVQLSAYMQAAAAVGDRGRTKQCPECRQDSLYQVTTSENGMPLRELPRPTCMNCGWPYMQSSSLHGSASVAKATGPGRRARQVHDRPVQVFDHGGRVIESFEPQASSAGGSYV